MFESAFLVLQRLRVLGLREVGGTLRAEGPFIFNWQPDPTAARLARALRGKDGAEAWHTVAAPPSDSIKPRSAWTAAT